MNYQAARATVLTVFLAFPVTGLPATFHGEPSDARLEKMSEAAGPGMPTPVLQKPDGGVTVEVAGVADSGLAEA